MPLPEKYRSPRMFFDKLVRLQGHLEQEVSWDTFNDFTVTAYHLYDWLKADRSLTPQARTDAESLWATLEFQACRDATNSYKHRQITKYPPQTLNTDVDQGFGCGGYGKGGYGVGEEQITITMKDGTVYDGLELACRMVKLWGAFFAKHPQLVSA